jgi:hypothetical protein
MGNLSPTIVIPRSSDEESAASSAGKKQIPPFGRNDKGEEARNDKGEIMSRMTRERQ